MVTLRGLSMVLFAFVFCTGVCGADITVGVYPGVGDAGILDALSEARGIKAQALPSYSPEALSALDVVVIPHGAEVAEADRGRSWRSTLRRYVELGGAIPGGRSQVQEPGSHAGEAGEGFLLFDLHEDGDELNNLAGKPEARALEGEMRETLLRRLVATQTGVTRSDGSILDPIV